MYGQSTRKMYIICFSSAKEQAWKFSRTRLYPKWLALSPILVYKCSICFCNVRRDLHLELCNEKENSDVVFLEEKCVHVYQRHAPFVSRKFIARTAQEKKKSQVGKGRSNHHAVWDLCINAGKPILFSSEKIPPCPSIIVSQHFVTRRVKYFRSFCPCWIMKINKVCIVLKQE